MELNSRIIVRVSLLSCININTYRVHFKARLKLKRSPRKKKEVVAGKSMDEMSKKNVAFHFRAVVLLSVV